MLWKISIICFITGSFNADFKSHDLGISASNLRRDRKNPTDILDRVDVAEVTDNLRKLLEIRNKKEQQVELDDVHAAEIEEYLNLLDPHTED